MGEPTFPREITPSTRLPRGEFLVPSARDEHGPAAVTIRASNATIDLSGVTLRGTPATVDPDQRRGVGIRVVGQNVTLRNARVHGYKIGLVADDAPGLRILNSDFSYQWKQRLKSTPEREDLSDWMSYHKNEADEWKRYGAGIYLRRCDNFEVQSTTIVGGQNGLMITQCNEGKMWNNNFSFLSSLGIGMYRSSRNRIMHNKIDWCVRGFSYGKYNRGQDSAGILIYEQSNENVFAYNSVTHGGDGFFLWAGQTTMDTGKGGCNGNLLYGNDFSHAPTNGIEATFSENTFANNLLLENWHGIWGGYSYQTKVIGNTFGYNVESIAIEHGQDNSILGNRFLADRDSIYLWANDRAPDPSWGYPKFRDTASRDTIIEGNHFADVTGSIFRLSRSQGININNNVVHGFGQLFRITPPLTANFIANRVQGPFAPLPSQVTTDGIANETEAGPPGGPDRTGLGGEKWGSRAEYLKRFQVGWDAFAFDPRDPATARATPSEVYGPERVRDLLEMVAPPRMVGGRNPFLAPTRLRGWRYMIVDEWGPYDFQRPLIRRVPSPDNDGTEKVRFEILGPSGRWRLVSTDGFTLFQRSGTVPGEVRLTLAADAVKRNLRLEYVGGRTVDHRGMVTPAGRAVPFGFEEFRVSAPWTVEFRTWDPASQDPRQSDAWRGNPVTLRRTVPRLDFTGRFDRELPINHFATVATAEVNLPPGEYVWEVTADDGVRLFVNDELVVRDGWKYQGPTIYQASLRGGKNRLRIEHFQIDGYAALQSTIRPR